MEPDKFLHWRYRPPPRDGSSRPISPLPKISHAEDGHAGAGMGRLARFIWEGRAEGGVGVPRPFRLGWRRSGKINVAYNSDT